MKELDLGIKFIANDEEFVRALFLRSFNKIGFSEITRSQTDFPDMEAIFKMNKEETVKRIELEYSLSNFFDHKHNIKYCDMIICWNFDLSKNKMKKTKNGPDVIMFDIKPDDKYGIKNCSFRLIDGETTFEVDREVISYEDIKKKDSNLYKTLKL